MEYTTLGSTGTSVSRICLGCMSFSESGEGWNVDRETATEIVDRAVELGVNFFDTANVYNAGESESILGDALAEHDRDEQVIATKVRFPGADDHRNAAGLSRKTIEQELDASLDRLGVDTADLYQIHRWDPDTPIETTLRTLDDAVRREKVRYLGASSMWAYQFAEALHASDRLGLDRFETMQNHYNLVYREEEREMLPLCEEKGVGAIPWSPLARGYLARPDDEFESTERGANDADERGERIDEHYRAGGGVTVNERCEELAAEKGVSMAQIALSWLCHQPAVDAPILGVSSVEHLEDAVEAVEVDLSESDLEYLEAPNEPVGVTGH
ncbi:aryl-alcohol dehydrogenase [Halosimplex carlsbadense 2-9-1]|uniref:Aryl-alcohol dehydrogenase n=1 Tax=Halosimplex carlsbadense 2-9-1 TaxID=797114 RepID=M0CYJ6_9EURY|nr:aldo/keto reductase [Halosimplex carlsbadense]ELZ27713.1 aryl-alcohol dehydrogenase [Halosimplex carlsbadense 2-9-1]